MDPHKKRLILRMLRAHQQFAFTPGGQFFIRIQYQNPGSPRYGQTGITCGREISGPGKRNNLRTEAAGDGDRGIGGASIHDYDFIRDAADTSQTAGQRVGFILDDHA
ncbi:hypothetical protein KC345_g10967 [Hortaea werneckii]|nr:hypothetical protein KC345_g10967 [Hortaea werneckii]